MPSAINTTGIDAAKPLRRNARTADVRANFEAIVANLEVAKSEITNLQAGVDPEGLTAASIAASVHGADAKTAPTEADEFALVDSADTWSLKRFLWGDLLTALRGYLDEFYSLVAHTHPADDTRLPKAGGTMSGALDMDGQQIRRPELKAISETGGTALLSGGTLLLDFATGNHYAVVLTSDVMTVQMINVPAAGYVPLTLELSQDVLGGRVVGGWPAGVRWPEGNVPEITAAPGATDILTGYTRDGGATWRMGRAHVDSR